MHSAGGDTGATDALGVAWNSRVLLANLNGIAMNSLLDSVQMESDGISIAGWLPARGCVKAAQPAL